jgi:hypothetical protein
MHALIFLYVYHYLRPIEKELNHPSVPFQLVPSTGISLEVDDPGALNKVL